MGPIEIIYNGYIEEREGIDTAETKEAADNLMGMIESLLPNSDKMQDILYMDLEKIWSSFGWDVIVCDGHDIADLQRAYAQEEGDVPKVILAKTVKGKGVSYMEGLREWHHAHLDEKQYETAIRELEDTDGV